MSYTMVSDKFFLLPGSITAAAIRVLGYLMSKADSRGSETGLVIVWAPTEEIRINTALQTDEDVLRSLMELQEAGLIEKHENIGQFDTWFSVPTEPVVWTIAPYLGNWSWGPR